jgi:tetratricopeptide (TPR) repeat protein
MQAENELSVEGEAIWRDLKTQFEWADKFDLFVLFTNNPLISKVLRERIKLIYTGNQTPIHYFEPQAPETLIYDVFSFLDPLEDEHLDDSQRSPIWLELNKYGEQWESEQKSLLARMNESRDRLRKHHPRPFVIVLNNDLSQLVRIISPDLWSVRGYSRILTQDFLVEVKEIDSGISQPIHTENLFNIHKERIDDIDQHPKIKEWQRLVDRDAQGIDVLYAGYDAFCTAFDNGFYKLAENISSVFLEKAYHLKDEQKEDRQVLKGLSAALNCSGDINKYHGNFSAAEKNYSESLRLSRQLQQLLGDQSEVLREISVSLNKVGDINQSLGNTAEVLEQYSESLAIRRQIQQLMGDKPEVLRDISVSLEKVADITQTLGNASESLAQYSESLAIRRQLQQLLGDRPEVFRDISVSLNKVGNINHLLGNTTEALAQYSESLALRRQIRQLLGDQPQVLNDISRSLNNLGYTHQKSGANDKANPYFNESLALLTRLQSLCPDDPTIPKQINWVNARLAEIGEGG